MPKREKKQKRDGNLATALKAANVTPDSYKEPEIKINAKALATNVVCQLLEEFSSQAVKAHIDNLEDVLRLGFRPNIVRFNVKLEALNRDSLDSALEQATAQLIVYVRDHAEDKYIAFATPFIADMTKAAIVTNGGVTAGVSFQWDRATQSVEIGIIVYILVRE